MRIITLVKKDGKISGTAKWVRENLESVTVAENFITCRISGVDYHLEYVSTSGCPCDITEDEVIVREFGYYPTDAMRRILISILRQAREIRDHEDFAEKIELIKK